MASADGNDQPNGSNNASSSSEKSLEGFITAQMTEQRANRTNGPGENIDDDKMNRFLSRALSESRRMTQEVQKSNAKSSKLQGELGADRMAAWRQEHSAQVLTPLQASLVESSQPK